MRAETRREIMDRFDEVFGIAGPEPTPEERARQQAEDYYEELLAEEKAADASEATPPTAALLA